MSPVRKKIVTIIGSLGTRISPQVSIGVVLYIAGTLFTPEVISHYILISSEVVMLKIRVMKDKK